MKWSITAILATLCYVSIVGVTVFWNYSRPKVDDKKEDTAGKTVIAKVMLPINHLIRESDLGGDGDKSALARRYAGKQIEQGAVVKEDDTAETPAIEDAGDGLLSLHLDAKAAEAGAGNATNRILVCRGEEKLIQAHVAAQFCSGDGDAARCRVLVRPEGDAPPFPFRNLRAAVDTCTFAPAKGPDSLK